MRTKPLPPALRRILIFVGGPLLLLALYFGGMSALRRSSRLNFEVVDKGRLLRTAQPRPGDLDRIYRTEGIGAILSLRGGEEREVKEWAQQHGVPIVSMQMWADIPPTDGQVGLFFDIMRGATIDTARYQDVMKLPGKMKRSPPPTIHFPFPVLLHCEGGSDRTGVMVALYRMAFQGWGVKLAQQDMSARFHFTDFHPAQFQFLERVAPTINSRYGSRMSVAPALPAAHPPPAPVSPPQPVPALQPSAPGAP